MERLSLYEIEDNLLALLNSAETVTPEQQQQYEAELAAGAHASIGKRQRCGEFLRWCQAQAQFCKEESTRASTLARRFLAAAERMEGVLIKAVELHGTNPDGTYKRLPAHSFEFGAKRNPGHVDITDESALPDKYKSGVITIKVRGEDARKVHDLMRTILDPFTGVLSITLELKPDKVAIKQAIATTQVPGAKFEFGDLRLVVD